MLLALLLQVTVVKAERIITVSGDEINGGMILIRDGKIAAVGTKVEVPEGARVIEANVVMPGLVNPYARIGLAGGGGTADARASDVLDALSEDFLRAARAGYTTLGLYPGTGQLSGRIVTVKSRPGPADAMIVSGDDVLRFSFTPSTKSKEELRKALTTAKEFIEADKKKAEKKEEPPKPEEPKKEEAKKEEPKKEKPKEPTDADKVMMDFLNGKRRALIQVGTAAGLLHLWQVLDEFKDFAFKVTYVLPSDLHQVVDRLAARKVEVILEPSVTFLPHTADRVCPARELDEQGVTFAFQPWHEDALLEAAMTVKFGVKRQHALRALTLTPAVFLGVDKRLGSIETGKDADLIFLSDDPFSAGARLRSVMIEGHVVYEEP